jgi:hypothetical protein
MGSRLKATANRLQGESRKRLWLQKAALIRCTK